MAIAGGRQVSPTIEGIRRDHVERYRFAAGLIPDGAAVLDAACGVGYGSRMLAELARPAEVVAVDVSGEAIDYAISHYDHPLVTYKCADLLAADLGVERFDVIVSFETLEHIAQDREFLARLRRALAPGGMLLISTPNEEVLPLDPGHYAYHVRHYTSAEFAALLAESGFDLVARHTQPDREAGGIVPGFGGAFDIAACAKAAAPNRGRAGSPTAGARDNRG